MMQTQSDPIEELIAFASQVDACMVPPSVLAFQCKRLMDNLGCLAAGFEQSGVKASLTLARRWSGCEEARVIGSGTARRPAGGIRQCGACPGVRLL